MNQTESNKGKKVISPTELVKVRGEIIDRFIYLERIMDWIICLHFLKDQNDSFFLDVLGDEHFSIRLKINILKKITGIRPKEFELIERMVHIRNIFSHSGGWWIKPVGSKEYYSPSPKKGHEPIDYEKLRREFWEKDSSVYKILDREVGLRGGKRIILGKIE